MVPTGDAGYSSSAIYTRPKRPRLTSPIARHGQYTSPALHCGPWRVISRAISHDLAHLKPLSTMPHNMLSSMAHCDVGRHRPERSAPALVHPALTTTSHTSRTQQDSIADTRAAHWQRHLCTAAVGAARGAGDMVSHSVHAARSKSSRWAPASPAVAGRRRRPRWSIRGCFLRHERAVSGRCSSSHCVAIVCGVRTGWLPRDQWRVDRRLAAATRAAAAARGGDDGDGDGGGSDGCGGYRRGCWRARRWRGRR